LGNRFAWLLFSSVVCAPGCFPDYKQVGDDAEDADDEAVAVGDVADISDTTDALLDSEALTQDSIGDASEPDTADTATPETAPADVDSVDLPDTVVSDTVVSDTVVSDTREDLAEVDAGPLCSDESCAHLDAICSRGVCTADGCVGEPTVGACDDGNPCTDHDACSEHVCGGTAVACDDGVACTTDRCDPAAGGCVADAVGCDCEADADCADATLCDGVERCINQVCVEGTAVACSPSSDPCLVAACATTTGLCGLVPAPGTLSCNDGKACTQNDRCGAGLCSGAAIVCEDNLDCSIDGCSEAAGGCFYDKSQCDCLQDSDCADGTLCNGEETCLLGECLPGDDVVCVETPDPCTTRTCQAATGTCVLEGQSGATCDDAKVCTTGDVCQNGLCKGQSVTCAQPAWCKSYQCFEPSGCGVAVDNCPCEIDAECSDTDKCNGTQKCLDFDCVEQNPVTCQVHPNACMENVCKPATGICLAQSKANNAGCDDGSGCTLNDKCTSGACGGTPKACTPSPACATATCDPANGTCGSDTGSCPCDDDGDCSDGNICDGVERCVNFACVEGTPVTCSDGNACNGAETCVLATGACQAGTAINCSNGNTCDGVETCVPATGACQAGTPLACSDNNPCNGTETCSNNACQAGTPVSCTDPNTNDCLIPICNSATGQCTSSSAKGGGTSCSDGNACTLTDTCGSGGTAGQCIGSNTKVCDQNPDCKAAGTCNTLSGVCDYSANDVDRTWCDIAPGVDAVADELGTCKTGACQRLPILAVGGAHSCVLLHDGTLKCWGGNSLGTLGRGDTVTVGDGIGPSVAQTPPLSLANTTLIEMGFGRSYAFGASTLRHWGCITYAALGCADPSPTLLPTFAATLNGTSAPVSLAGGVIHACRASQSGAVRCWGLNGSGAFGVPTTNGQVVAIGSAVDVEIVPVGQTFIVAQVVAGLQHTCVRSSLGAVKCWGAANRTGQGTPDVVYGDDEKPSSYGNINAGWSASFLAAGTDHTCAVSTTGAVYCWGLNGLGVIGNGTIATAQTPTLVNIGASFVAKSAAAGTGHTCLLTTTGAIKCWGGNADGELGRGNTTQLTSPPVTAIALANPAESDPKTGQGDFVAAIDAGGLFTCVVMRSGSVKCWGDSSEGQLGVGSTSDIGDGAGEMPPASVVF